MKHHDTRNITAAPAGGEWSRAVGSVTRDPYHADRLIEEARSISKIILQVDSYYRELVQLLTCPLCDHDQVTDSVGLWDKAAVAWSYLVLGKYTWSFYGVMAVQLTESIRDHDSVKTALLADDISIIVLPIHLTSSAIGSKNLRRKMLTAHNMHPCIHL